MTTTITMETLFAANSGGFSISVAGSLGVRFLWILKAYGVMKTATPGAARGYPSASWRTAPWALKIIPDIPAPITILPRLLIYDLTYVGK